MKKRLLSLFLVFIFSFTLISTVRQKETKAVATTIIAGYTISQILGALALSASVVAGGYVIGDVLVEPEDNSEFTEFLKVVFNETLNMQKFDNGPPPPKPLSALESSVIWSMLTKQGIEVGKDLYDRVYDFFIGANNVPQYPDNLPNVNDNFVLATTPDGSYVHVLFMTNINQYVFWRNGKISSNYAMELYTSANGGEFIYSSRVSSSSGAFSNYFTIGGNMIVYTDPTMALEFYKPMLAEPPQIPANITPPLDMPTYTELPNAPFKRVDMSPLNGLVKNPQELIDIANGDKVVSDYQYGKITEAFNDIYNNFLNNPNFYGESTPLPPSIDPATSTYYYGDPLPDEPIIEPVELPENELGFWGKVLYWLKAIWQTLRNLSSNIANSISNAFQWLRNWINTFWTNVNTLIDDFWMTFTTWWQDNFLYHWTSFIDWLHTLPGLISGAFTGLFDLVTIPLNSLVGLIQDVWNWLQGFPEMIYGFFIPPSTDIAEVWDPFILLWNDKLEPVKAPLDQLLFYETELQDISANLEFNGIGGTYKIIDYQYVKSVKDQVKGIIRAFFWILIIFFNVDQVHRLIRNQGIIKSYVRKLDEPGGKS